MSSRYSARRAQENINGNQYDSILAIANRARELHNGHTPQIKTDLKNLAVIALEEADAGFIGAEYIAKRVIPRDRRERS